MITYEYRCVKFVYLIVLLLLSNAVVADSDLLASKRYIDPNNFFTIVPPANWKVIQYSNEERGKVAFSHTTKNVELRVLSAAVDFNTLEELISGSEAIEERIGKSTNIKRVTFNDMSAISRSFEFNGLRLLAYDFLLGNIHYNIQYGAPPSDFPEFQSLAEKSMATYEPLRRSGSEGATIEQGLAGKRRIAKLAIEMGQLDLASDYVEEGLKIAPSDEALIKLAADIDDLRESSTNGNKNQIAEEKHEQSAETENANANANAEEIEETSKPVNWYVIAVIASLAFLGFVIWGIHSVEKGENGIFAFSPFLYAFVIGGALLGEAGKAGAHLPVLLAVIIFISGFAFWFFRIRKQKN